MSSQQIKNDDTFIINHLKYYSRFDPKLRLAVLASGNGTNFESLVLNSLNNKYDFDIKLLIVNEPSCGAIHKASKYNVKSFIADHRNFAKREDHDKHILNILKDNNVEAVVMAGWMRIVSPVLINQYPGKIINIHPSILPSFKGTNSIKRAKQSGALITGCTVHLVNDDVDSGQILCQAALPILNNENLKELTNKIHKLEHKLLPIGICIAANLWRKGDQG